MGAKKRGTPEFCVVLAGPEYGMNVGMAARAMRNFGFSDLRLVSPRGGIMPDAVKYSKHAVGLLKKAGKHRTLREAVRGCGFVVGTTGILKRNKGTIRSAVPLKKFCAGLGGHAGEKVALVFGREGIGLNEKEISACDLLVHVEADSGYPVLNLGHAVAVVLYSVRAARGKGNGVREERLSPPERRALTHMFNKMAARYRIRNPKRCKVAFARVLARANPTKDEGHALLNVFRLALEELGGKDDAQTDSQ
ncbi:MAG: TrmH family RNA methyltransferase [Candidatus ainarchaeum sp.]|nr:TrmH family RNA methyltransferase [Candidatus ainarchaeum sp.]